MSLLLCTVHMRLANTRPTTPAGAAAMLAYIKAGMEAGAADWQQVALDTLIATLASWGKAVRS